MPPSIVNGRLNERGFIRRSAGLSPYEFMVKITLCFVATTFAYVVHRSPLTVDIRTFLRLQPSLERFGQGQLFNSYVLYTNCCVIQKEEQVKCPTLAQLIPSHLTSEWPLANGLIVHEDSRASFAYVTARPTNAK